MRLKMRNGDTMPDNSETINWQSLTPNQRDALVAQHIFGRDVVQWHPERDMLMRRVGVEGHESIPKYTTSMDEAWKVLQAITADEERALDFADHFDSFGDGLRFVEMPMYKIIQWVSSWAPETIAIAALKAHGVIIDAG